MVLESLITPITAEKKPWRMFFFGFLFSSLALVLSLWVFRTYASLLMVVFTVIACLPFIVRILKLEEEKDIKINDEIVLLKEHSKAIAVLTFLFLGMVISFALWFVVMPSSLTAEVYYSQMQTISSINTQVAANYVNSFETFTNILFNNLRVLSFCILFSFIYGAGAIFILTWNASVIGAAIGNFIRTGLNRLSVEFGFNSIGSYFHVFSMGLLRYLIHGIPEVLAYFIGGLAGGIISFAVINHHFGTKKFENIILDTSELIILALFLLLIGSFLEVYLTPLLF